MPTPCKGRRPSWSAAAPAGSAEPLVQAFCDALRALGAHVETGVFGAMMQVSSTNDGPVTLVLDGSPAWPAHAGRHRDRPPPVGRRPRHRRQDRHPPERCASPGPTRSGPTRDGGRQSRRAHGGAIELHRIAVRRQALSGTVEVQHDQPSRRPAEIVDARDGLLTAVAPFVQVHGRADPADLVRDRLVVGVHAEPRLVRSDPSCLVSPGARRRSPTYSRAVPSGRRTLRARGR